ncbi:MAG: gamma-glutamylcyclotransferase family protein [Draconibacterium sp.]|nr:gamma-glutamylcyclotransferase family protein [Draconibacterium sp.]
MQSKLVFVYGSLKSGHHNHALLRNAEFVSNHITEPKFTLLDLGKYPAVLRQGTTSIHGEIYLVDQETFRALDKLEAYPDFYDRVLIPTEFGEAWMYTLVKKEHNYPVIKSGNWELKQ